MAENPTLTFASTQVLPLQLPAYCLFKVFHLSHNLSQEKAGKGAGEVMNIEIPKDWEKVIGEEFNKEYFKKLEAFVGQEREDFPGSIFPPEPEVFSAFTLTPYHNVKVLLLGQDPYIGKNQAHGLCFSVLPQVPVPPSLRNIYKELKDDLGCSIPNNGYLIDWAKQGILMLNAVLTVRQGQAFSHRGKGWEIFTDAVIQKVNEKASPVVFLLWGNAAQKKISLIDTAKHIIVKGAHPSPLSAKKFFGSRPFSKVNKALKDIGEAEIDWQIPNR
jgi:uracil-DNA glycosylase